MTPHSQHANGVDDNNNNITSVSVSNAVPPLIKNTTSSSSLREHGSRDRDIHEPDTSYSPTCCYNSFNLNPPFDSAMALTVLALLTALFFVGFFSIYIRRFADENSVDPTRRRRSAAAAHLGNVKRSNKKGVDSDVVQSLPVYAYNGHGDVEQGKVDERECAICLSEFEEREMVKEIPYCGHVFHVECIVTWLSNHVTCPLCRTAEFFPKVTGGKIRDTTVAACGHAAMVEKRANETASEHVAIFENDTSLTASISRHVAVAVAVVEKEVIETANVIGRTVVVEEVRENVSVRRHVTKKEKDTWQVDEGKVGPENVRRTNSCCWNGERVTLHRSLSFG